MTPMRLNQLSAITTVFVVVQALYKNCFIHKGNSGDNLIRIKHSTVIIVISVLHNVDQKLMTYSSTA